MHPGKYGVIGLSIFVIFAALANMIGSVVSLKYMDESYEGVYRGERAHDLTDHLMLEMLNQENSIRGYIATQDREFLNTYYASERAVRDIVSKLFALDRALESHYSRSLIAQIERIQVYFREQIDLIDGGRPAAAVARLGEGKTEMDEFRAMHATVLYQVLGDIESKQSELTLNYRFMIGSAAFGSLVSLVFAGFIIWFYRNMQRAASSLMRSEEQYRELAEELEAQNADLTEAQASSAALLQSLSEREASLAWLVAYQERLVGNVEADRFLSGVLPSVVKRFGFDSALLYTKEDGDEYVVAYTYGAYGTAKRRRLRLFGAAWQAANEKRPTKKRRALSGEERGAHAGYDVAEDYCLPLLDVEGKVYAVLQFTIYGDELPVSSEKLLQSAAHLFGQAYFAISVYDENAKHLSQVNALHQQLTREKELLDEVLRALPALVVVADGDGNLYVTNYEPGRFFGLERIALTFREMIDELENETLSAATGELFAGAKRQAEALIEGPRATVFMHGTALRSHEGLFLFVFRDVTKEHKLNRLKDELVSVVSHELRTPIGNIQGVAELLNVRPMAFEEQKELFELIRGEADRLNAMVTDYLNIERLEAGYEALDLEEIAIPELLRDLKRQWEAEGTRVVELACELPDARVRGDRGKLTQAFHNLISNAFKYAPNGERAGIVVRGDEDPAFLRVDVQDEGIGIPEEARDRIFDKFYRVETGEHAGIQGTGLGLNLVKSIVEKHGGTIGFTSVPDEGTTFHCRLPRLD